VLLRGTRAEARERVLPELKKRIEELPADARVAW